MAIKPHQAFAALQAFVTQFPKGKAVADGVRLGARGSARLNAIGAALEHKAALLHMQAEACHDAAAYLATTISDFVEEDVIDDEGMGWVDAAIQTLEEAGVDPDPLPALLEARDSYRAAIPLAEMETSEQEMLSRLTAAITAAERAERRQRREGRKFHA